MRHEIGLKLKKTLREIDAMPFDEFTSWCAFLILRGEERKKATERAKRK